MRVERWRYVLPLRLRSILQRNRVEKELHKELEYHLGQAREEYLAKGLDEADARREALKHFGGVEPAKERCREARGLGVLGPARSKSICSKGQVDACPSRTATSPRPPGDTD